MRARPLATAAAAALVVGAVAGPALAVAHSSGVSRTAGTATVPAVGSATSTLTLLSLLAGSHDIQVGGVTLSTDTLGSSPLSSVSVVPIRADGKAYGTQTVTPANSPGTVGAVPAPAALAGLFSVNSPVMSISATNSSAHAGMSSLGSVSLLGMPVGLDGGVDAGSSVGAVAGALGDKTLTLKNVALPDIASLLAAQGLDLTKLPAAPLTSLVDNLGLVNTAITTAESALTTATAALQTQIDAANAQIATATATATAATTDLAAKTAALNSANSTLASATSAAAAAGAALTTADAALTSATSAVNAKLAVIPAGTLAALPVGSNTIAGYALLTSAQKQVVDTAVPGTSSAYASYVGAGTAQAAAAAQQATATAAQTTATTAQAAAAAAAAAAQTAFNAATTALATAKSALAAIIAPLAPQIAGVVTAVIAQLKATPLVSLDSLVVETTAAVTSANANGQVARVVGGRISGLKVLGTDVLSKALGSSSVDAVNLVGATLGKVQTQIASVTGALSSALSHVPSLPSLSIPAPEIGLLTKATSVGVAGGFGTASATIQALKITLPAVTIPAAVAVPNAPTLPAISGVPAVAPSPGNAVTDLVSKQITIGFGTVGEQAKFKPAVVGAPGSTGPSTGPVTLPKTGLNSGIGILAVALVGGALVIRRRTQHGATE